jgi:hypothetical protein
MAWSNSQPKQVTPPSKAGQVATEKYPPGVGRVPAWWMEVTPHYTLDLEEEEARDRADTAMAYYYEQMAIAADAGMIDAEGNPIVIGPDGKPTLPGWGSGWHGRAPGAGVGAGESAGPLGPNFVPGQVTPETLALLGIHQSDPEYTEYLTGAKFPAGYWEKLEEIGYQFDGTPSYNNLKQTSYGQYGRQAENPLHKPAWVKKKLRSTDKGSAIRSGDYKDSPGHTLDRFNNMNNERANELDEGQEYEEVEEEESYYEEETIQESTVQESTTTTVATPDLNDLQAKLAAKQAELALIAAQSQPPSPATAPKSPVASYLPPSSPPTPARPTMAPAAPAASAGDLNELQAMLAAKQAELARLQGM